jgi:glycosyltransferase involved in cell wall biosynthesis
VSPPDRLSITYLLAGAPLFGGVKVILRQADLLHRRGHRVVVAVAGARPDWYRPAAELCELPRLDPALLPAADVLVATYWTTIDAAVAGAAAGRGRAAHYCQGLEYTYTHNRDDHAAILAAYRQPLPALTVSGHLGEELERRFERASRLVLQPLEPAFRQRLRWRARGTPRILVCGPYEIDWKGVETSLLAVQRLRGDGVACRLVRLSQWPLTSAERELGEPDEFHCNLRPDAVADLVRRCDLLLAPSWEQEGFGLPALEAMAAGVPVVASDVPCYRSWAAPAARLVPARDPAALAKAAREVLESPALWRTLRRRGLRLAKGYREARAVRSAEQALRWVARGGGPEERLPA